ncbi:hypothetical protein GCM10022199_06290 [Marihabitans asiaticum]|uniref:TadE-like protein n=1 Tax=Marihabitans asiaticum TaxID=415218 RepID=A0A560WDW1_9MICO|nr:TadE family type IV pilus minor pilin [Marihabitans asiaticum]TWD15714.1 hypothetical protein FB557_1236 [Marihabitans asiaticum]
MVTAELAVAVPAVVLVLSLCLTGVGLGVDHLQCADAARIGARELARAEDPERVARDTARAAPPGAAIAWDHHGDLVEVTVRVGTPALAGVLGVDSLSCSSAARVESSPG